MTCALAQAAFDALAVAFITSAALEGAPAIAAYLDAAPAHVTEADLRRAGALVEKECRT